MAETKTVTTAKTVALGERDGDVIKREEYLQLDDELKADYVEYNPSVSDQAMNAFIEQANSMVEMMNKLAPLFEKIKVLPNPTPAEQIDTLLEPLKELEEAISPIEKLADVPIIKTLVKPLVNLLNKLLSVIGLLLTLILMSSKGLDCFMDTYVKAVENTDWEGIKKTSKDLISNKKNTPSVEKNFESINWDGIACKPVRETYKKTTKEIKDTYDSTVKVAETTATTIETMSKTVWENLTWDNVMKTMKNITKNFGVDWSMIEIDDKRAKQIEKMFPDPSKAAKNISSAINTLSMQQYIKKDVLAELEKRDAERKAKKESEKKS